MTRHGCRRKRCCLCHSLNTIRDGFFRRECSSHRIQKYRCKDCKKCFSGATDSPRKYFKLRNIEHRIEAEICSGVSGREAAKKLRVSVGTVERRMPLIHEKALKEHEARLRSAPYVQHAQFDELITSEETKLKQVSVPVLINADTYMILGTRVAMIPTSGTNARRARKLYGFRPDESRKKLDELMQCSNKCINSTADIRSDMKESYAPLVEQHFPTASYSQYKSERATVAGQGELKTKRYDPIFAINHVLAALRYRISRLIRRTWNTTKKRERLQRHLDICINFYNRERRPANRVKIEQTLLAEQQHEWSS